MKRKEQGYRELVMTMAAVGGGTRSGDADVTTASEGLENKEGVRGRKMAGN